MTEYRRGILPLLLIVLVASAHAESSEGIELSGGMDLTSRYLYRGLNQSGDGPALQGFVEASSASGLYAGVWASTVEWPWDDRRYEFDYFLGYHRGLSPTFALDATVIRYTYHGGGVSSDYDWTEVQLTAHLWDHWSFTVSGADNWIGRRVTTGALEGAYRHALSPRWMIDAAVGHAEVERAVGSNYQWGELGLTHQIGPIHARIAFSATHGAGYYGALGRSRALLSIGWRDR